MATAGAQTTTWVFTTVADSRGEFAEFSLPAINDNGQVAFTATFDNGATGAIVYRADGGTLVPIADTSGPLQGLFGEPTINLTGTVAFSASLDGGGDAVLTGSGAGLTTVASTLADNLNAIGATPFINDPGDVVFFADRALASDSEAILKGSGGALVTVVDESGPYGSLGESPSIDAGGLVAFGAAIDAGGFGLFTTTDGVVVNTLASSTGFTVLQDYGINNNSEVVVRGTDTTGVTSLSVRGNGAAQAFVDDVGIFNQLGPAGVSESGTVAFHATLDEGLNAIFAGGVLLYEAAIAVGDPLNGSTVTQFELGPQPVTTTGPFAFWAKLADGTEGVYVASPGRSSNGGGGGGAVDALSLGLLALLAAARRRCDLS